MLTPKKLSFYGSYHFGRQAVAEVLTSVAAQTALYGQFILGRMFQPSSKDVTLLFVLLHVGFFLSPILAEWMRTRPVRPFYIAMLVLGSGAFFCGAFVGGFWGYAPIIILGNFAFISLFVPLRNRLMGANFKDTERGRCYSTFSLYNYAAYFVFSYAGALALDRDPSRIRWMFPLVGLISAVGIWFFLRIRVRGEKNMLRRAAEVPQRSIMGVYSELLRLFIRERRFLLFQLGFIIYGFGFMFSVPREVEAVGKTLALDYSTIVLGLFGVTPLARILIVRVFGKMLDQKGPFFVGSVSFAMLIAYPLVIWAAMATKVIGLWYAARIIFGLGMAGVDLAWTIGPVCFGDASKASSFSGAHIFIVAVRATTAPFIGQWVWGMIGPPTFAFAAAFFLLASLWMRRLAATPMQKTATPVELATEIEA